MIRSFIFDLDGVIVFTDRYHYLGWKELADEEGWRFDQTLNHQLRGVSRMQSLQIILDHNGLEFTSQQKDEFAARKNRYYQALLDGISTDDLYPGAVEFVGRVRSRGLRTALGSSSRNADRVLKALEIDVLFDAVVTGHDLTRTKPDPQIFQLCAQRLGDAPPDECVVFEDAESGIEAALAAGMHAVGVGDAAQLPNAEQVISEYTEIDLDTLIESGRIR
ncbi:MAG: beta-phosphoglucomutase [Spirochaetaceae bacterium]|nr:MAG: beta-phosphoglucomutase [Spirochaetaceae bacterium]